MGKEKTIDAYFKRKNSETQDDTESPSTNIPASNLHNSIAEQSHPPPPKCPRLDTEQVSVDSLLIGDPGLRPSIMSYPPDQRDMLRRAYINHGPFKHILPEYPLSEGNHPRRFQSTWFQQFPSWLEYSPSKDAAFCLPCYLFFKKPDGRIGSNAFISEGFRRWRKVHDGKNCAFLVHMGKAPNSSHNLAEQYCSALKNQSTHITNLFHHYSSQQVENNRLRLKVSADIASWLTFQGCALRGHDEGPDSKNRGNFIETIKKISSYNNEVREVVLDKAPKNATYTSPKTQKEILHVFSVKIRRKIREEIDDAKFCILVDEARDESTKEQMALVLRYVDKSGSVRERFFDLIHVSDTKADTLKKELELSLTLSRHNLSIQNMRGQGYDGASNMSGEWNGLQAKFLEDCPYAYYIHCLAHRLQQALVTASKEVKSAYQFFSYLVMIVNNASASSKRHDELQAARAEEINVLIANDDLDTGSGKNQINTLQRPGDTRWSSHFNSICSLMTMFSATCSVLKNIMKDGANPSQRWDAKGAYDILVSFDFIFGLHLMREIMGFTNDLCQALQRKNQDILNAMHLVSTTKKLIQEMRENGWEPLFKKVLLFCEQHGVDVPDMNSQYVAVGSRGRPRDDITMQQHYKADVFVATIDTQMKELDNRFNKNMIELISLSSALDPKDGYKLFDSESICKLAKKFYPMDFTEQEKLHLSYQLEHYYREVSQHPVFQGVSSMVELCQKLTETKKSTVFPLVDRLIRLVLTLPVSTATTERAFSAMKIIKNRLRNKMGDEYLTDSLLIYIEKEIAKEFSLDSIVDEFIDLRERKVKLK